jgi:multidrug efflux pump subunit AcrA (membrane-fusion protein)
MFSAKRLFIAGTLAILIGGALTYLLTNGRGGRWESLHRGTITEAIYGLATLEAEQTFRYKPAVISQLKRLYVKEGEPVEKGQALLSLSEGPVIRSPIKGVVTQLDAKESETCFPNTILITVMNLDQVELAITLEQASALRVRPAQQVKVQFESLKGDPIRGVVRTIYPKEGQFSIRVRLQGLKPLLNILPGMTADTAIEVGTKENVLLAPLRSVQQGVLTIEEDGKRKKIKPAFGLQDPEFIEVVPDSHQPLSESTRVWVSGT